MSICLKRLIPSLFDEVIVVTQYDGVETIASRYGFKVIFNQNPELGISNSVRLGVKACTSDQLMFIVSDMPNIRVETIKKMTDVSNGKSIVSACVNDELFNPMIFPRCYFDELNKLNGDKGAKRVALVHDVIKVIVDPIEISDIDTKEDLENLLKEEF